MYAAEAGGHRGGFLGDPTEGVLKLTALVPLVVDYRWWSTRCRFPCWRPAG